MHRFRAASPVPPVIPLTCHPEEARTALARRARRRDPCTVGPATPISESSPSKCPSVLGKFYRRRGASTRACALAQHDRVKICCRLGTIISAASPRFFDGRCNRSLCAALTILGTRQEIVSFWACRPGLQKIADVANSFSLDFETQRAQSPPYSRSNSLSLSLNPETDESSKAGGEYVQ